MKNNKRGFTIVELVIVIAVIAILASVLVPSFAGVITKAKRSADTQVVSLLNSYVKMDLAEKGEYKHETMYDAIQACVDNGLSPDKIAATSDLSIAWEASSGEFVLLDVLEGSVFYPTEEVDKKIAGNESDYFVVTEYSPNVEKEDYLFSTYAYGDKWPSEITIHTSFDAGNVLGIEKITYVETQNTHETVIIRSCEFSTRLVIDGTNQTEIKHYGFAGTVDILKVADNTYNELGVVGKVRIAEGHFNAANGSEVFDIEANTGAYISISNGSTVYDENGEEIDEIINRDQKKFNSAHASSALNAQVFSTNKESCLHNGETRIFTDSSKPYEVCKPCGATLITIYNEKTKETYKCSVIVEGEEELMPMGIYTISQIVGETLDPSKGSVELKTTKEGALVEPEIYSPESQDLKQQKCEHKTWTYSVGETYGTHVITCTSCKYSYVTIHNFVDYVCADCNYVCDHYTKTYTGVKCDVTGDGKTSCKLCGKVEIKEYKAGEHIWYDGSHNCIRSNSECVNTSTGLDYSICCNILSVWFDGDISSTVTPELIANVKDNTDIDTLQIMDGAINITEGAFTELTNTKTVITPSTAELVYGIGFNREVIETLIIKGNENTEDGTIITGSSFERYSTSKFGFSMSHSLKHVIFQGRASIDMWAFAGCASLEDVDFTGVIYFGQVCFQCCTSLTKVFIPNTVKKVGYTNTYADNKGTWMFDGCCSLKDIYVEDPLTPESFGTGIYKGWIGSTFRLYTNEYIRGVKDDRYIFPILNWSPENKYKLVFTDLVTTVRWGCTQMGDEGTYVETIHR